MTMAILFKQSVWETPYVSMQEPYSKQYSFEDPWKTSSSYGGSFYSACSYGFLS